MKKVIDGKRYDTDTAILMGSDKYSNFKDFTHWTEELYRKRNGEYFLYGEGGPMTKYAQTAGQNEWSGGEKIMPLTPDAARKWAEEHLSVEKYEAIFGAIEEDNSKMVWSVSISPAVVESVKRFAGEKSMKLSEVVETALTAYFKAQTEEKPES